MESVKKSVGRPVTAPAPWGPLFESIGGHAKLAAKLGVAKSTIGRWVNGECRIPELGRRELLRLCKKYGVTDGLEKFQSPSS